MVASRCTCTGCAAWMPSSQARGAPMRSPRAPLWSRSTLVRARWRRPRHARWRRSTAPASPTARWRRRAQAETTRGCRSPARWCGSYRRRAERSVRLAGRLRGLALGRAAGAHSDRHARERAEALAIVAALDLPHPGRAAAVQWARAGVDGASDDRPQEVRAVGQSDRVAALCSDGERGAQRGKALGDRGVEAAVDEAVGLLDLLAHAHSPTHLLGRQRQQLKAIEAVKAAHVLIDLRKVQ